MTTTDPATAARAVAHDCARAYLDVFGDRLVAVYLLGSLAYGGYAPAVSDIDLAVVLTDLGCGDRAMIDITSETLRAESDLHRTLSVFWSSLPALREGNDMGRFPVLDRLQLADHGLLLLGEQIGEQIRRPTERELLLDSAQFAVSVLGTDEVISEFRDPRRLVTNAVWFTKAVLFPVRFLYSSTTTDGRAATNTEAVTWYLNQPHVPAASLVRLATRVRTGHTLDPAEIKPELATGLIPLYEYYLDDQTRRLRHAHAPAGLITEFIDWRRRLQ